MAWCGWNEVKRGFSNLISISRWASKHPRPLFKSFSGTPRSAREHNSPVSPPSLRGWNTQTQNIFEHMMSSWETGEPSEHFVIRSLDLETRDRGSPFFTSLFPIFALVRFSDFDHPSLTLLPDRLKRSSFSPSLHLCVLKDHWFHCILDRVCPITPCNTSKCTRPNPRSRDFLRTVSNRH